MLLTNGKLLTVDAEPSMLTAFLSIFAPSDGGVQPTLSGFARHTAETCCRKSGAPSLSSYRAPAKRFAINRGRQWLQPSAPGLAIRYRRPLADDTDREWRVHRLLSVPEPFKATNNILSKATQAFPDSTMNLWWWMRPPASSAQGTAKAHRTRIVTTHVVYSNISTPFPPSIGTPVGKMKRRDEVTAFDNFPAQQRVTFGSFHSTDVRRQRRYEWNPLTLWHSSKNSFMPHRMQFL